MVLLTKKFRVLQGSEWTRQVIEIWFFDIVWNLSIVIWDFNGVSAKANLFYLTVNFDVTAKVMRSFLCRIFFFDKIDTYSKTVLVSTIVFGIFSHIV